MSLLFPFRPKYIGRNIPIKTRKIRLLKIINYEFEIVFFIFGREIMAQIYENLDNKGNYLLSKTS